jgi:hypothetical protein
LITAESLPIKERLAGRLEEWPRNSLQIVLLSDGAEHLPVKEGSNLSARKRLVLLAALRARTLVAAASGARVPIHDWILSPLKTISRKTTAASA